MFIYLNKKGQNTLEYAVIIVIVVLALLSMQFYLKRGVQGKLREASDDISEGFSPTSTTYTRNTNMLSNSTETKFGGALNTNAMAITNSSVNQSQNVRMQMNMQNLNEEWWPAPTGT